jgi:hypothetical protein
MDITLQTKVKDNNRDRFYQQVYRHQFDTKQQLINLELFSNDCVLVDCCGWHYRNLFPKNNIKILETVKNALQFKLDRVMFDKLIDDQRDEHIGWPELNTVDPILIFDRSPILKYRSIPDLIKVLNDVVKKYHASELIVNLDTTFVDDTRLVDRFCNLSTIGIDHFIIVEFAYKANTKKLFIHTKRKHAV